MRLLLVDPRRRQVCVVPEVLDDLWVLEKVLERGDILEADVLRSVKLDSGKKEQIKIHVRISVEKIEFHEYSHTLRVGGKIVEAVPERYVGKGKYQTITIPLGKRVCIEKAVWRESVVDIMRDAEKETRHPPILLISMDDKEAVVAVFSFRVRVLARIRNKYGKRSAQDLTPYFGDVLKVAESAAPELVLVGGPGFIPDEFCRFARERGKKKYVSTRTAVGGMRGIHQLISDKASDVVRSYHLKKVDTAISEFLRRLSTGAPVAVGEEVEKKALEGAVELLLVHEKKLFSDRERVLGIMDTVRTFGGNVLVVPECAKDATIVEKFGGLVAILRF